MLGWLLKKKDVETRPARAEAAPLPTAEPPAPTVDWQAALAQAQGDDEALLALARGAQTPLAVKQAAVGALATEAALKQAEREFRSHDRRVHQIAKQRLQAQVAQRQTLERAAQLLQRAHGLAAQADVAVNQITELERAWQSLDAAALAPAQQGEFGALTAQLATQVRERAETEARHKRWQAEAAAALAPLRAACAEAAAGTLDRAGLAAAIETARAVAQALPAEGEPAAATQRALAELQHALQTATLLDEHLAVLDRLLAAPAPAEAPAAEAPPATADDPQRDWQALPPLPEAPLAALLQGRHAAWLHAREQARQARQQQGREQARERQRAQKQQAAAAQADELARAEAALDAGHPADAQRLLGEIEAALRSADAPAALQTRLQAAQARLAQLRGWQHWAGSRARDELVLQAEALAAATVGGDAPVDAEAAGDDAVAAEVARLSIRQRADLIQTLRQRWKDIDDLGGPGAHALWRRFDAALAAAGAPVAAHIAAQRATREANLAARQALLDALEAVDTTTDAEAAPAQHHDPARRLAAALDHFRTEWRKHGPVEHTVPRASRDALVARMEAAVARLEAPLQAARSQARAQREALVARARALAAAGPGRDLVDQVRALQAEWQQHAKRLPLARADEQALWTEFKGAIDTAFAARNAAHHAREAEFEGHAAERHALIERLRQMPDDSAPALRRLLADTEAAWRQCGPAPRARAAALEAEFQAACGALRQRLDHSAQNAWQTACEALEAKLRLCEQAEAERAADATADGDALAADWAALPALPAPLEDTLRRRAGLAPAGVAAAPVDVDNLLLQIEIAWELPTPPAFEAARRARKLLAMKTALEGRRAAEPQAQEPAAMLAQLLGCAGLNTGQRARLAAVLAARRRRGPQGAR